MSRSPRLMAIIGLIAYALLPWHVAEEVALFSPDWTILHPFGKSGSALGLGLSGSWWLLPLAAPLLLAVGLASPLLGRRQGLWLTLAGLAGFAYLLMQGFAIGLSGWNADWLVALFGAAGPHQPGMGIGALIVATTLLLLMCRGLAGLGWCKGDAFLVSAVGAVTVLIALFVFFPLAKILVSAFTDNDGKVSLSLLYEKISDNSVWGFGCLGRGISCGVAWNTILLAVLVGLSS